MTSMLPKLLHKQIFIFRKIWKNLSHLNKAFRSRESVDILLFRPFREKLAGKIKMTKICDENGA